MPFLFDDVLACTTTESSTSNQEEEDSATAVNVVDFLNMFYGGTKLISDDLATQIAQAGGADASLTRLEFEQAFGVETAAELSAGFHPTIGVAADVTAIAVAALVASLF